MRPTIKRLLPCVALRFIVLQVQAMQQPILHPVSDPGVFLGRTKCTIALQVAPDGQPIRRLSPSSSTGSSHLHKSNPWTTGPGSVVGPDSAVNQPAPTSKLDDTSTSKAQAPEAGGSHRLSQQTHGGAKAEGASSRETPSEFQKLEAASAPAAEAATKGLKSLFGSHSYCLVQIKSSAAHSCGF